MSAGKALRKDGVPTEIYKAAGPAALEGFHSVVTSIWEDEDVPQELRYASIISLFNNKGSRLWNYRTELKVVENFKCLDSTISSDDP